MSEENEMGRAFAARMMLGDTWHNLVARYDGPDRLSYWDGWSSRWTEDSDYARSYCLFAKAEQIAAALNDDPKEDEDGEDTEPSPAHVDA